MVNYLKAGFLFVVGLVAGKVILEIAPRVTNFAFSVQVAIYLSLAILLYFGYELIERRF